MRPYPFSLYLVRHGEARYQLDASHNLDSPDHLTELGRNQALTVGKWLSRYPDIEALYSSALGRAYQTAVTIGVKIGMPVRIEPGFNEITPFDDELKIQQSEFLLRHSVTGLRNTTWSDFPAAGQAKGEAERILRTFDGILRERGLERRGAVYRTIDPPLAGDLVIVSHSGTMQTLLAGLFDLSPLHSYHLFEDDFAHVAVVCFAQTATILQPRLTFFGQVEA